MTAPIRIFVPGLRIKSVANAREHWTVTHRHAASNRALFRLFLNRERRPAGDAFTVRMVRIAPRALDDDNIRSGFKAIRDEIAAWLGINDKDPRVSWVYSEERSAVREYAARVEVEVREVARGSVQ